MRLLRKLIGDPLYDFSNDEVQRAALDILWNAGDVVRSEDSYWGGTVEKCDTALVKIMRLRSKYAGYEPRRMRIAIIGWLDFYESRVLQDRRDCMTQSHRKEMDRYREELEERRARTRAVVDALKRI